MVLSTPKEKNFQVFKLSHDALKAMLPISDFESNHDDNNNTNLNLAVTACCNAMNGDGLYTVALESLSLGLSKAISILQRQSPIKTLYDIRKWALEVLQEQEDNNVDFVSNTAVLHTPLAQPNKVDQASDFASANQRSITPKYARGILANAFFCNCVDTMKDDKDQWNQGGLDWRPLLANSPDEKRKKSVGLERMKCLLLYFETCSIEAGKNDGTMEDCRQEITFERIRYHPTMSVEHSISQSVTTVDGFVGDGIVLHNGTMEDSPRSHSATAIVNFANSNFGYGKFIRSCTQEEILITCYPEFAVGMLWIGQLSDDEVVTVSNLRRYSTYTGYGHTFECIGPISSLDDTNDGFVVQDVLAMDASRNHHFRIDTIRRDIGKAYHAFSAHAALVSASFATAVKKPIVSTGKWGCGIFGGLSAHKLVQQALAAHLANVDLDFSVFGNMESCDVILEALQTYQPTASKVMIALKTCQNRDTFVRDFVRTITEKK